jgi:hypothetical protein
MDVHWMLEANLTNEENETGAPQSCNATQIVSIWNHLLVVKLWSMILDVRTEFQTQGLISGLWQILDNWSHQAF